MGWLAGWSKRIKITIDSDDVDAALSDFPIQVYLSAASGIGDVDVSAVFDEIGANSLKIAVTKSDGTTECYVEVEKWDSGNEKAWLWVKVSGASSIASGADTDLYIYYDNAHANNTTYVGATNSTPAENVWDSDFLAVLHMRDDPDTSHTRDSTGNDLDGTKAGANKPAVTTAGLIADAQEWAAGDDEDVDHGNMTGLDGVQAFTIEFSLWKDALAFVGIEGILGRGTGGQRVPWIYGNNGLATVRIHFETNNGAGDGNVSTANLTAQVWNYVAYAWDGSDVVTHLDGTPGNSDGTVGNTLQNTDSSLTLGYLLYAGGWLRNAYLDEVRISTSRRSAAWIKATYESNRDDFVTFGSEETLPAGTEDLAAKFTVRHPDSQDLAAGFEVRRSDLEDLGAKFTVRQSDSQDLGAELVVRHSDSTDLAGALVVRHPGSTELAAKFTVRQPDSEDLAAKFTVRQPGSANLAAQLVVRHSTSKSLGARFEVGQDSQELSAELIVRQPGSQNLAAGFIVRQPASVDLAAGFAIRCDGTEELAAKFSVFHPGGVANLPAHFSVRRPGIDVSVTLEERDVAISLEERDIEIILQERDIAFTLEERGIAISVEERGITISFRDVDQTMVNLGDTFQLKGECTDLDGDAEDPTSQSIRLYDVEDTLIDTDTNPTAGVPTGEFYANLEAKDDGEPGAWTVLWEVTSGVEKRTVIFDVAVNALLG